MVVTLQGDDLSHPQMFRLVVVVETASPGRKDVIQQRVARTVVVAPFQREPVIRRVFLVVPALVVAGADNLEVNVDGFASTTVRRFAAHLDFFLVFVNLDKDGVTGAGARHVGAVLVGAFLGQCVGGGCVQIVVISHACGAVTRAVPRSHCRTLATNVLCGVVRTLHAQSAFTFLPFIEHPQEDAALAHGVPGGAATGGAAAAGVRGRAHHESELKRELR